MGCVCMAWRAERGHPREFDQLSSFDCNGDVERTNKAILQLEYLPITLLEYTLHFCATIAGITSTCVHHTLAKMAAAAATATPAAAGSSASPSLNNWNHTLSIWPAVVVNVHSVQDVQAAVADTQRCPSPVGAGPAVRAELTSSHSQVAAEWQLLLVAAPACDCHPIEIAAAP